MNPINFATVVYDQTRAINVTAIAVNLAIFALILAGAIVLLWKIKLDQPGYKRLFVFYTLFWFPLMLVRSYRGTLNNDLEVSAVWLWVPLTVYGLVGIFLRPLFDFCGAQFRSRKRIVYFALALQIATFIPVIAAPSFATNVIQAVGVGVGASCIGTFSLWFNEQYAKTKPFLTISVLSLPPLLADFLASPIQSVIRGLSLYGSSDPNAIPPHADPEFMRYLWVIGLGVILINCVVGWFLRENPASVGLTAQATEKKLISEKRDWWILAGVVLVGASIDFTKFATADSIATLTIQDLGGAQNTGGFEGYLSAVFSGFQLAGGILMGMVLSKKIAKSLIYVFGACFFVLYNAATILVVQGNDPTNLNGAIAFLAIQALNGFGYGVLYNLLIAHVLSLSFATRKFSPLGLYQAVASLSIACGTFFTSFIKGFYQPQQYAQSALIVNAALICVTAAMGIVYYFVNWAEIGRGHRILWKIRLDPAQREAIARS